MISLGSLNCLLRAKRARCSSSQNELHARTLARSLACSLIRSLEAAVAKAKAPPSADSRQPKILLINNQSLLVLHHSKSSSLINETLPPPLLKLEGPATLASGANMALSSLWPQKALKAYSLAFRIVASFAPAKLPGRSQLFCSLTN